MKNQIIFIFLGVLLLFATSCAKDFLTVDPVDSRVLDNFYKNEAEVQASTAVLYSPRPWYNWVYGVQWQVGDLASGDMYHTWSEEGQFFFFSFSNTNGPLQRAWVDLYRVNSWCNSVINDMPIYATKNGVSETVINAAVGEARFIRAWVYFLMTEYWKDVPIIANGSELIKSGNMMMPRNTQNNIYEFIRRDLEFAEINLPGKYPEAQNGRATKWAAKGLMAKLYLTMGAHGDAQYYTLAKQYAQEVISNPDGFGLNPDYGQLFTIAGNNNKESLFALQCLGAGGYSEGSPRTVILARSSVTADVAWGGGKGATIDYVNNIEAGDLRRYYTFMQLGDVYPEINSAAGGYTYHIRNADGTGTVLEGPNDVLNNIKKYMIGKSSDNNGLVGTNQDAGNNIYFMRFAEMYLIYAEAAIGTGTETSDQTAIDYVNIIRDRAGLPYITATLTYDQVMHERRYEFGMEGIRWFDIKRMFYRDPVAAVALLNAQDRENKYQLISGTPVADQDAYAAYEIVEPTTRLVIFANMVERLPIPQEAITMNPLLEGEPVEYIFE
jgi:hypothetical protein